MNTLDPDILLHTAHYMNMSDIAQLRATCKSNRYLFSSYNSVIGQALVNQYGATESVNVAFEHCGEEVASWICQNFMNQFDRQGILIFQELSEVLITSQHRVNWWHISRYQVLSEAFIRYFQDKVRWMFISQYQNLSEEFTREFKDKVDWMTISQYQQFSKAFKDEFKDKLDPQPDFSKTVTMYISRDFSRGKYE